MESNRGHYQRVSTLRKLIYRQNLKKVVLLSKKAVEMVHKSPEYEFKIDVYTPASLPMSRLAEYMASLASFLGESEHVHFVKLKKGSARLVCSVESEAEFKVNHRIRGAQCGDETNDAAKIMRKIDRLLAEDNATGVLVGPDKANIVEFPGRNRFSQQQFGPFNQPGSVDGVPIRVGGENDPVPVHLQEPGQSLHMCLASRSMAREIAPHIFGAVIRADGMARWHRDRDGQWIQDKFTIQSFRVLEPISLKQAVEQLRAIPTGLNALADPVQEIRRLREG